MKREPRTGNIKGFIAFLAYELKVDYEYLREMVHRKFPALKDRTRCANCGASMMEYVFTFDAHKGALLFAMAKNVRSRIENGESFTDANRVHVPSLRTSHTVKCQTTQASKLGLVAKAKNSEGKQVAGTWVITERGWKALAGEPVPKQVRVFRGEIEERTDETATIGDAFKSYRARISALVVKGKKVRTDLTAEFEGYTTEDWRDIFVVKAGPHQGNLL